eukprot:scaffold34383_cov56-Isochrysis_galbana.AAC.1
MGVILLHISVAPQAHVRRLCLLLEGAQAGDERLGTLGDRVLGHASTAFGHQALVDAGLRGERG